MSTFLAELGEEGFNGRLEAEALSGREVGGHCDLLDVAL